METKSYNETYLANVAENLGAMLEYAVECNFGLSEFWEKFVLSDAAKGIEKGNVRYLAGYSAADLLNAVANSASEDKKEYKVTPFTDRSKYYWAGWILAQYQYHCGNTFFDINRALPIERVLEMYGVLHEADVTKFFNIADEKLSKLPKLSKLKKIRQARGLSQKKLAEKSGVDLRSIQMYEQRRNDINKAQAETLLKLSRVLGCRIEDLMD